MYVGSPLSLELMRAYWTPGSAVIDMPASMANPDGPWVVRQRPLGETSDTEQTAQGVGWGLLIGVGAVIALAVVGFKG